jgi:hypothetical protein
MTLHADCVFSRKRGSNLGSRALQLWKSTRKAACELGISQCSVHQILHSDVKLFPYKMSVVLKLSSHDKGRRL